MINSSSITLMASLAGLQKIRVQALQAMAIAGQIAQHPDAETMSRNAASLVAEANEASAKLGHALQKSTLDFKT